MIGDTPALATFDYTPSADFTPTLRRVVIIGHQLVNAD